MAKKYSDSELSQQQLEKEIKRTRHNSHRRAIVRNSVLVFVLLATITVLAVNLWFPVLQISESSMSPTLENGQAVVALRKQDVRVGDLVAFYQDNHIVVKRVIAGAGDLLDIDAGGHVSVNGSILDEPYVHTWAVMSGNLPYTYYVPDGCIFVMGDSRSSPVDSSTLEIDTIPHERILGKVIFRIWPLNLMGYFG